MKRNNTTNNTQPVEPVSKPAHTFAKGEIVHIRRHTVLVGHVSIQAGGISGVFCDTSFGPKGEEYITIYSEGYRFFPLEHAKPKKHGSVTTHSKRGSKITIECVGLKDKPCANTREIHASDKHLVSRCKDCQKIHAKSTNKERMRQKRLEKQAIKATIKKNLKPVTAKAKKVKNEPKKKKVGRNS